MSSASDQPRRYFFVHIMRTGGTALVHRLREHFGDRVYPASGVDGPDILEAYLSIGRLRDQLATRGENIHIIAGHFPLCTAELIEGPFTTLTLLREPVERTLSFLRRGGAAGRGRLEVGVTGGRSLEDAYDELLERALERWKGFTAIDPQNNMTRMLSMSSDEIEESKFVRVELSRDHLERAKKAIAEMGAVGVQEHLQDFFGELAATFGWDIGKPVRVNATSSVEVSDSFRTRIAEDNAFDVELYAFAEELVHRRERSL